MTMKVVIFFEEGEQGWTETYYNTGSDPLLFRNAFKGPMVAQGDPGDLRAVRRNLLAPAAQIIRCRASVVGQFRQEASAEISPDLGLGTWPGAPGAAETFAVLQLAITSAIGTPPNRNLYHSDLFLGGIPEQVIAAPTSYVPTADWNGALGAFENVLKNPQWVHLTRPDRKDATHIETFTPTPDAQFAVVAPVPIVPPNTPRGFFVIRGIHNPRGWNGRHSGTLQTVNGIPTVVIGPLREPGVTQPVYNPLDKGTIQFDAPLSAAIQAVEGVRLTRHKRGRFFGQPRGRR